MHIISFTVMTVRDFILHVNPNTTVRGVPLLPHHNIETIHVGLKTNGHTVVCFAFRSYLSGHPILEPCAPQKLAPNLKGIFWHKNSDSLWCANPLLHAYATQIT
jgi:hypothetical protein